MIKMTMRYNINSNRTTLNIKKNSIKQTELNKIKLYPGFMQIKEEKGIKNYVLTFNGNIEECEKRLKIMFDKI